MSHEKYWDYCAILMMDIQAEFEGCHSDFQLTVFKLTASPYYFWEKPSYQEYLEFIAQSPPKASAGKDPVEDISQEITSAETSSTGPSNADASKRSSARKETLETELRSGNSASANHGVQRTESPLETGDLSNLANKAQEVRSFVRSNLRDTPDSRMTKSARNALLLLLNTPTGEYKGPFLLNELSDDSITAWYDAWVKDVKI